MLHRLMRLIMFAMVLTLQASSSNAMKNNEGEVPKNEGVTNERNETDQSGNQVIYSMSHEDLVMKFFEMENEMKSQNGRIQSQEKRINNQEKKILLLETRSGCGTNNEDKTSSNINSSFKINPKRRVKRPASSGSSNKVIPKNKLYDDPDYPDTVVSRGNVQLDEPTNCNDLRIIGHYLNGFYLVKNDENVETIFCNFSEPSSSVSNIGDSRIKVISNSITTSSNGGVHFFVQRKRPWTTEGAIPFQIEKLNIGGAIDVSTGIFTTPRNGVYHFAFSGIMQSGLGKLYVLLRRNMNETIAVANSDVRADIAISPMISFTATVRLQKDDRIDLYKEKSHGVLYDSHYYSYTSYTGSLLMDL